MRALEFLKSINKDAPAPVLFLIGKERLLQRLVITRLSGLLLPEGGEGLGAESLDGRAVTLPEVLDSAAMGSLLAGHRIVVVWEAGGLSAPSGSPELSALERYLDSPNPAVTLVFAADSVNRAHHPFKLLVQKASLVECDPLKGAALQRWIADYLRERGCAVGQGGVRLIEELLGNNLLMIRSALDKVMLYCGERRRIEYEDLEKTMNAFREHAVWELTNAIGARDAPTALGRLARLLDEGKHPLQIVVWLQIQFRQLMTVRELLDRRLPREEIIEAAGLRYYAERTIGQARAFSAAELRRCSRHLFDLEDSIKSAGVEDRFLLEHAVLNICRRGQNRAPGRRGAA